MLIAEGCLALMFDIKATGDFPLAMGLATGDSGMV